MDKFNHIDNQVVTIRKVILSITAVTFKVTLHRDRIAPARYKLLCTFLRQRDRYVTSFFIGG